MATLLLTVAGLAFGAVLGLCAGAMLQLWDGSWTSLWAMLREAHHGN